MEIEKISVDVICLTKTVNTEFLKMCLQTLQSLWESEDHVKFDVVLVESGDKIFEEFYQLQKKYPQNNLEIIQPQEEFGYNKFLNHGMKKIKNHSWLMVINNDLIFTRGWFSRILKVYEENPEMRSFSPFEPDYHPKYFGDFEGDFLPGYRVGYHVSGWCLVMRSSVMQAMGSWDEKFLHWYQDDDFAEFLKTSGIQHCLVRKSIVHHLKESSTDIMPSESRELWTKGMSSVWKSKWEKILRPLELPKIKLVHLLLNPDFRADIPKEMWNSRMEKQKSSQECWRRISHNFYQYVESYNLINRKELPSENCAQPEIINRSFDLINRPPVLSYGHYGAFKAHSRALLEEFSNDLDAILIVEGDVQFAVSPEEMVKKIYDSIKFMSENNGSLLTFGKVSYGLASSASASDTSIDFGEYKKIDHFLCAHCYLVTKAEREDIQYKLMNTGWHAWDIWLYWNYDKRCPIFSTKEPLVWEPEGFSLIDYKSKNTTL